MDKLSLNEMLEETSLLLRKKLQNISSSVANFFNEEGYYIIFLSATDEKQRARVVQTKATTYEKCWEDAVRKLRRTLLMDKIRPVHIKADIVTSIETMPFPQFISNLTKTRKNYFRKGIAFDRLFQYAFLEQEINANVFFNQWENKRINIATQHIEEYSETVRHMKFLINLHQMKEIHLFETMAVFHDGVDVYELDHGLHNNGTRIVDMTNSKNVISTIQKASSYVVKQNNNQGKFEYVNFPAFHKGLDTYNILHHANTVYSLLETYQQHPHAELLETIERALHYIIDQAIVNQKINGMECAFILETVGEKEIKLGANAFALLVMAKYAEIVKHDTFNGYMEKIANGILYMQQRDGSFHHVFHEDLSVKEEFRIYFYEGEAILSLVQLYNVTEDRKWLMAAERSFRYAIKNNYWKHGDPYLNEASYLIYKHRPHIDYATFNLQNTKRQLGKAFTTEEVAPLLLRLLLSTSRLITYMKQDDQLGNFPIEKLYRAIHFRVRHQMSSYFWPEMAMYFSKPKYIVNSFYVRHDSYRIQINDVADNIVSLLYYEQFLNEMKEKGQTLHTIDKESGLLLTAKHLEKQGKIETAIKMLSSNLDLNEKWLDETYALYGSYLRLDGKMELAKEIIGRGNAIYPQSEVILVEFLNLCMSIQNWHAAKVVVEDLLKINPKEGKYYLELGRALAEIKETEKAKAAFKIGLIYHHNISTERLIEKVQSTILEHQEDLLSEYTFLGGMNNLGVMIHEHAEEKYFTKITRVDEGAKREAVFYRDVQTEYPYLKEITPAFIGLDVLDDVQYLTIKHVDKLKEAIKIEQIIQVVMKISNVSYEEISKKFPNPTYPFVMRKNTGPDIIYLFTKIHEREQNQLLLSTIKRFAQEYAYPLEVKEMLDKIENMIISKALYEKIQPEKHYSLLHADLKLDNMVLSKVDGSLYLLDWGAFTIGPRFADMALLLSNMPISYQTIIDIYINGEEPLTDVEQFYFGFAYFLSSFVKLTQANANGIYARSLLPAMEHMEECFARL